MASGSSSDHESHNKKAPNLSAVDLALRLLLFASAASGLVVLATSKETKTFLTSLPPPFPSHVDRPAKFHYSPALIYLLVAQSVACLYSIITVIISYLSLSKPCPSTKLLFFLIVSDAAMVGVMASATGTAGAVAYLGLKGNSHVGWSKMCNVYGKFCKHIGSSTFVSLVASVALVVLVGISSYSLHRRTAHHH
ncbi:CASP-like protein 1D1 [Canna indica]|uniref:CASP-like protein n=1 Tax=Canna indica TaxID=4628 RepID=A0AAQ3QGU7_9LILI|nr:CASP-like protein 1D1 [Canna indica]